MASLTVVGCCSVKDDSTISSKGVVRIRPRGNACSKKRPKAVLQEETKPEFIRVRRQWTRLDVEQNYAIEANVAIRRQTGRLKAM